MVRPRKLFCLRARIQFSMKMFTCDDILPFFVENMNYANGFPCPADVQADFIDHNSQSTWNTPPNMPAAWGHASFISSPVSVAHPVLWTAGQPWIVSSASLILVSASFSVGFGPAKAWLASFRSQKPGLAPLWRKPTCNNQMGGISQTLTFWPPQMKKHPQIHQAMALCR